MLNYLPRYFTSKAIFLYIGVLVLVNIVYFSNALSIYWWISGIIEVVGFFYFSNLLTRKWSTLSEKKFSKKLFQTSLLIRVFWVIFSYLFYLAMTGQPYEFHPGDVLTYQKLATDLASRGFSAYESVFHGMAIGDRGYATYLGTLYMILGNGLIIPRLIKALLGSFGVMLIYKFTVRNFGEGVGRMAAVFCMLMPNLIYYTASHLKEAEMVFLIIAFIERADFMIKTKNFSFINITVPLVIVISLFFLRTALGLMALLSLFTALMFSTNKILGMGKRTILIVWVLVAIAFLAGGKISTDVEQIWSQRGSNQENSLQMRTTRVGGNKFAKYAGGLVFAPMIFVIPFPTIVDIPKQENQELLNGGNYVKNIMAFFVIMAFYWVLKTKKWRDHLLIGSFTLGYLGIIAFSAFAQSERFHQPVLPFELIMAAYGLSMITNKQKKYFTWWMVLIFVAIVGWSWFKLAGRGMA